MTVYKYFGPNDRATVNQPIYEYIPITGSIVYGTYGVEPDPDNVKKYSHGMFQTVYDYPYLSSSANKLFDLTACLSTDSLNYASVTLQQDKKRNIYNQMSQVLVGYDESGSLRRFDQDGNFSTAGDKIDDAIVLSLGRLIYKDEIRKETFSLDLLVDTDPSLTGSTVTVTVADENASTNYFVNSPSGEYAILYASGDSAIGTGSQACGLIYYQAGVVVLNKTLFMGNDLGGLLVSGSALLEHAEDGTGSNLDFDTAMQGNTIDDICDSIRQRIVSMEFSNTTEINSTIYFCRIGNNEFNYSSNPTYLSASKIRTKRTSKDAPVTYITTVGLYSADDELMAVGKLSEPLKKDPSNEMIIRTRLDW